MKCCGLHHFMESGFFSNPATTEKLTGPEAGLSVAADKMKAIPAMFRLNGNRG
jgi:hypothetical protein